MDDGAFIVILFVAFIFCVGFFFGHIFNVFAQERAMCEQMCLNGGYAGGTVESECMCQTKTVSGKRQYERAVAIIESDDTRNIK